MVVMSSLTDHHPVWGEGMKALRSLHRITQTELAEKAGTSQSVISDLENDKRKLISDALRIRIARALHTDAHALFPYREDGAA